MTPGLFHSITMQQKCNSGFLSSCCLLLLCCVLCVRGNRTLQIGFIHSDTKVPSVLVAAAELAVSHLNIDPTLEAIRSREYQFSLKTGFSDCTTSHGLYQLVKLALGNSTTLSGLDAVIGPQCDVDCEYAALLTSDLEIPTISFACVADKYSNNDKYPYFCRTIARLDMFYHFLKAVIRHFDWDHVVLVSPDEPDAETLKERLEEEGIAATSTRQSFNRRNKVGPAVMRDLASDSRVFVLLGNSESTGDFLLLAHQLGMMNGDYVFMTAMIGEDVLTVAQNDSDKLAALTEAVEGLLDLTIYEDYNHSVYLSFNRNLSYHLNNETDGNVHFMLRLIYDAFYAYALAINDLLLEGFEVDDRDKILNTLYPREFIGASGPVTLDTQGDRHMNFVINNIRHGKATTVGDYNTSSGVVSLRDGVTIVWSGGGTKKPSGIPDCGWQNVRCVVQSVTNVVVGSVVAAVLVTILIVVTIFFIHRNRKQQQEMHSMAWRITSMELQMGARKPINFGSRISKGTLDSTGKSMVSITTDGSELSLQNQLFTSVSTFRGSMVAIKPIHKPFVAVTDGLIQEINAIRALRHFNVNQLVGACSEPQKIAIVSQYCGRGSLADVLENDRIKLDWIFKMAFAADIANGMSFIHDSPVECHGRLKSSNVLIDSHWTCKISDFAMPHFREGERSPNNGKHAEYYQLLWTAPEFLRNSYLSSKGTRKGDVYSFAIILQEIIMRTGPYGNSTLEPQEIIEKVKSPEHPYFRPTVPSTATEEAVLDLMRICWEEIPAFRPNFVTIRDTLKKLNNGQKINLVDQMLHMMEKYADHLEELVEDRTTQLAEEQKKTEELLSRMLPKKISDDLKHGKHVVPESFESVTIYFSDIVGFTALAGESSPLEVVDLLNDLYTCFDTVLESYDVYKVETIGDAYMVVSGMPVRNGIRHAGEIATMALDLLSSMGNFRIRHRPDKQLQLRVGVHSGPAVAGVVGLKMPRYCLFGDTVNYASRMESSGLALRVHVSPECYELLVKIGGFHLTLRGDVTMKGKGVIQTYFLEGKDGYHKPLPDLSKAASLEEHTFK